LVKIIKIEKHAGKKDGITIIEGFCADDTSYLPFRITADEHESNN
jgi:hypothetical protein